MIDGFSVLLPTYNNLSYLKVCLESLKKYSTLKNQVSIVVDGSTDGTCEWLRETGHEFTYRAHRGAFSGWNLCAEKARKDLFFIGEDDFFFLPNWDVNLARWIEELPDDYIIATQIIEPFKGSYLYYDCGDGPAGRPLEEEKLKNYASRVGKHTLKTQAFSMFAVSRRDWEAVGGYDERFDPVASGTRDLQMRLHRLRPRKWVIAEDVFVYHFKPQGRVMPYIANQSNAEKNIEYFKEKWGMDIPTSDLYLEAGL